MRGKRAMAIMPSRRRCRTTAALVILFAPPVLGEVTLRDAGTFVVDQAGIVDADVERNLEGWLRELEQKTTAQLKLITVPTTDGEPVFAFAQRHAELWKLGRKGKDNGALVVVAVREREVRIHVGYGLESVLPDSWCGSLSRNVFAEQFKKGNFSAGVFQGMVAIANKIADASKITLTGLPDYRYVPQGDRVPPGACGAGVVPIIIFIILMSMARRRRYYRRWGGGLGEAIFWGSMLSRGNRGGWGGGFRTGGFGGGFGGSFGGGGRFGGGGGGARW